VSGKKNSLKFTPIPFIKEGNSSPFEKWSWGFFFNPTKLALPGYDSD